MNRFGHAQRRDPVRIRTEREVRRGSAAKSVVLRRLLLDARSAWSSRSCVVPPAAPSRPR